MPYKNREKYRAYQKAYYQKRKHANSAGRLTSTVMQESNLLRLA
jgi:hypothetical protein